MSLYDGTLHLKAGPTWYEVAAEKTKYTEPTDVAGQQVVKMYKT